MTMARWRLNVDFLVHFATKSRKLYTVAIGKRAMPQNT